MRFLPQTGSIKPELCSHSVLCNRSSVTSPGPVLWPGAGVQSEGGATQLSSPLAGPLPSEGQSESCLQNLSQTAHRLEGDLGKKGGLDHSGMSKTGASKPCISQMCQPVVGKSASSPPFPALLTCAPSFGGPKDQSCMTSIQAPLFWDWWQRAQYNEILAEIKWIFPQTVRSVSESPSVVGLVCLRKKI